MRVLVTGSSGFLGWHLVRYLEQTGTEVHGTYNTNRPEFERAEAHHLDIREAGECERLIAHLSPSHIIHTAALSQTGDCERNPWLAHAINVTGTANLISAAAQINKAPPHFVHLSTDLVFDGTDPPYDENAEPNPIQIYGKSKLAAERISASGMPVPHTILRSALIFGSPTPHHQSFLQWMLKLLRGETTGKLFTDEYRSPIWVHDLCRAIELICKTRTTGLYHCGGPDRLSRWDFGQLIAEIYRIPINQSLRGTRAQANLQTTRPADITLNPTKLQTHLRYHPTSCHAALMQIASLDSA